jgi:hypothetical protein
MKIVSLQFQLTTHRLLFKSASQHALLIKGEGIRDVGILVYVWLCRKKAFSARIIMSR